jgi:hypothetical protein
VTDREVINLWERAQPCGPTERALLMLAAATGSGDAAEGLSVSIGARDAGILALRQSTFGRCLRGALACPTCGERLDFSLDVDTMRDSVAATPDALVVVDGLRFRLPTSADLLAIEGCTDADAATHLILDRCCLDRSEPGAWPAATVAAADAALAAADPGAAIDLAFACAVCAASWSERLDVVSWTWAEIDARAQRLLDDVHVLAARYGWREDEILALGSARRSAYLERCWR